MIESRHLTSMPNLRGSAATLATRTIKDVHNNVVRRIRARMPWDRILTQGGRTQAAEREYIYHLREAIIDEGGIITEHTGTQQSLDIRGVKYPGIDETFDYEAKKINGKSGNFCLNDTLPYGEHVYYIFLRVNGKSVDIRNANELANDESANSNLVRGDFEHYSTTIDELGDCVDRLRVLGSFADASNFQELFLITTKLLEVAVKSGIMSLFDYGQIFKFTTNFGFFKSRPRPNWSLSTKALEVPETFILDEKDDDVPINSLIEKLSQRSSE